MLSSDISTLMWIYYIQNKQCHQKKSQMWNFSSYCNIVLDQHSENNGEILKSQKGASRDFTQIFNSSRLIKESTVY